MPRPNPLLVASCFGLLAVLAASACANDFQALFNEQSSTEQADAAPTPPVNPPPTTTVDSGGGGKITVVDAGGPLPDASSEGGGVPACTPAASCTNASTHECGGGNRNCVNTCSACGCTCPRQDCGSEGSDRCTNTCSPGTSCDIECDIDGECRLESHGAVAKLHCADDDSEVCTATCDQGGSCEVLCENKGGCTINCAAGTACLLRCQPGREVCEKMQLNCTGTPSSCAGGTILACNRDCP